MGKPASEKQLSFRGKLIRQALGDARAYSSHQTPGLTDWDVSEAGRAADPGQWYLDIRDRRKLASLALMLAMPEPADSGDCSEQISSLKFGGGMGYGRDHREWAQQVNARFVAAWGEDQAALPKVATVAEMRAIATGTVKNA